MSEVMHHPETGATITVDDPDGVPHYRRSGWLLLAEHQANQAQATEREQAAAKTTKEK